MQNQVDYKNGADINTAPDVESELLYGKGRAYGLELYVKKKTARFTGWISYIKVRSKDTVMVEMRCIDKAVYDYFYSLDQISSTNGNSATPANPVSNILGGALGYFSAHTVRKVAAVIP